tara:strand:- start:2307 stop:2702 length:396 start_codon:yes stop_codon:yes gene_type:complete
MISYKKINLLDISLLNDSIKYKESELEIKSPIMLYEIKDDKLYLNVNKNSDAHNLFLNICGYIDRLYKLKQFKTDFIQQDTINVDILDTSNFYNENNKIVSIKNVKTAGKAICSFKCVNGNFNLVNFLMIM